MHFPAIGPQGPRPHASEPAFAPGRAAHSPGHRAKAIVENASAGGAVPPANAQGLAASAIARGQDAAALFALSLDVGSETPLAGPVGDPPEEGAPQAARSSPNAS